MTHDRDYVLSVARGEVKDASLLSLLGRISCGEEIDDALYDALLSEQRDQLDPWLADQLDGGVIEPVVQQPREVPFVQIPRSIIVSGLDNHCYRLYSYLDLSQKPSTGYQVIGEELGWQARTISAHVQHLVDAGIVAEEKESEHSRRALRLLHNPARARRAPGAKVPPPKKVTRPKRAAPKIATKHEVATPPAQDAPQVQDAVDAPTLFTDESTDAFGARPPRDTTRVDRVQDVRSARAGCPIPSVSEVPLTNNPVTRVTVEQQTENLSLSSSDEPWPEHEVIDRLLEMFPGSTLV